MHYLITGGTGLIGSRLCHLLSEQGHTVSVLSRSKKEDPVINYYDWDLKKEYINPLAVRHVDVLIHLAGAGIAASSWTKAYKQELIDSRVLPLKLLLKTFQREGQSPGKVVSASGISVYGMHTGDLLLTEVHEPASDFIAHVVTEWEAAADHLAGSLGIPAVKLRTGIVLSREGGALPKMALPVKLGIGSPIGDGNQWISWIHIDDLCQMYVECSENDRYQGVYHAVGPDPVQNSQFTETLAQVLNKPLRAPNVPAFLLKLWLGERAQLVLGGNKVASAKVEEAGFRFKYPDLKQALEEIYKP